MNLSASVSKAISKSQLSSIMFDEAPSELLFGEDVDLSKWSMTLTDRNMDLLSRQNIKGCQYSFIDSSQDTLKTMFTPFFEKRICGGLMKLNISYSKDITNYGITCIARNSPLLEDLIINGCSSIEDAGLREVGLHCRQLRSLIMSSCHGIEGGGFISISDCCNYLKTIDISHCKKLVRWAVHKLFEKCTTLEVVNMSHVGCIGDDEIRALSQSNSHITSIIATETLNISDTGLLSLTQFCPHLEELDLSRRQMTTRITDVCLLALGERCRALRVLSLNGCDHITDVGLNWLSVGCLALEKIDLGGCVKVVQCM